MFLEVLHPCLTPQWVIYLLQAFGACCVAVQWDGSEVEEAPASPAVGGKIKRSREHHYAIAHVLSRVYSSGFSSSEVFYIIELKEAQSRTVTRMAKGGE